MWWINYIVHLIEQASSFLVTEHSNSSSGVVAAGLTSRSEVRQQRTAFNVIIDQSVESSSSIDMTTDTHSMTTWHVTR